MSRGSVTAVLIIILLFFAAIAGYFWWQSSGRFCGGPFNIGCSKGETCQPNDAKNPGAGGTCSPMLETSNDKTNSGKSTEEKYFCQTDKDCIKDNTCSEDCVNVNYKNSHTYTGPQCGRPWISGCKCQLHICTHTQ